MKCAQCRQQLAALAGGDLDRRESERCEAHVAACPDCARQLRELRTTIALLRRVGAQEPLPRELGPALRSRLALLPPPALPWSRRLVEGLERLGLYGGRRPALALAAVALGALLLVARTGHRGGEGGASPYAAEQEVAAAFRVPAQRVAVVHLDFVADVALADVEFEVTLPTELHFVDGGKALAERTLLWRGSLAMGRNPIPLAVSGAKPGRYRVTAQARGSGVQVRHDILLEVVPS